ncbi:UPF0613 protein PB24D3.06c-like isoform X3 [Daucus carota subsp. sativus]|uniref:UPF0613 protein PB24D3.06c-like isoform X3 n=1 Tax=Daucus carota subsp. sativus TaxID=79200 RepID=UPI003082D356
MMLHLFLFPGGGYVNVVLWDISVAFPLLFKWVAFKTGDYKQQAIFIGGLTDGFLATDYLEPLAIALDKEKWSLVQFLLSSSYSGYGLSSLKENLVLVY